MDRWIAPMRWFGWTVVLLMVVAMVYAGVMALINYSAIAV